MNCPKCKKQLLQISGLWTPETPNLSYRKYICHNCRIGYTEIVDRESHNVVRIEETDLNKRDDQVSLMRWMKE